MQGGANGADEQAWLAAKELNVFALTKKPDWAKYGKRAGVFRNIQMLEMKPQYVIALWDSQSRGTLHTIENAVNRYRIPVWIVGGKPLKPSAARVFAVTR